VFRASFVLALSTAAVALVACGSADSNRRAAQGADLVVTVAAPDVVRRHIRCPGAPECARLAKLRVSDFDRPNDMACTQQFGGDWKATVVGTLHDRPLAANFMLTNGCEISRWQRFAWLLGKRLPQTVTG
jgi:hypothetical protein